MVKGALEEAFSPECIKVFQ